MPKLIPVRNGKSGWIFVLVVVVFVLFFLNRLEGNFLLAQRS